MSFTAVFRKSIFLRNRVPAGKSPSFRPRVLHYYLQAEHRTAFPPSPFYRFLRGFLFGSRFLGGFVLFCLRFFRRKLRHRFFFRRNTEQLAFAVVLGTVQILQERNLQQFPREQKHASGAGGTQRRIGKIDRLDFPRFDRCIDPAFIKSIRARRDQLKAASVGADPVLFVLDEFVNRTTLVIDLARFGIGIDNTENRGFIVLRNS